MNGSELTMSLNDLLNTGGIVVEATRTGDMIELLNWTYSFSSSCVFPVVDEQYVSDKIATYKSRIIAARSFLEEDPLSRRSIVLLNQLGSEPNCMVSVHFQLRRNFLWVSCHQRSQHILKVATDCEIITRMCAIMKVTLDFEEHMVKVNVANLHKHAKPGEDRGDRS